MGSLESWTKFDGIALIEASRVETGKGRRSWREDWLIFLVRVERKTFDRDTDLSYVK